MERNVANLGFDTIIGFEYVLFSGISSAIIESDGRVRVTLKNGYTWNQIQFTVGTGVFTEKPEDSTGGNRVRQSFSITGLKDSFANTQEINELNSRRYAVRIRYKDGNLLVGEFNNGVKINVERSNSKYREIKISFDRLSKSSSRWEFI